MLVANIATDDLAIVFRTLDVENSPIAAYMDCIRKKVALQLSANSNLTRLLPVLLQSAGRVFSYLFSKKSGHKDRLFPWDLKLTG
jgi:hypothetical protein